MNFELWAQCRQLVNETGLSVRAAARQLGVAPRTVARALRRDTPQRQPRPARTRKLDGYRGWLQGKLEQYPELTAWRLLALAREVGYPGGYTQLKEYLRELRPRLKPVYLTLHFAPGEAAQIDWGTWDAVPVEGGRRRLHFFVMVLCHSRLMHVSLSLGEGLEHWLDAHVRAFTAIGGVPLKIIHDNPKTAVLEHRRGQAPIFHPHYLELAQHYGFTPVACNPRQAHEKGRVESAVGLVKRGFLAGRELGPLVALEPELAGWLPEINGRLHRTTGRRPMEVFAAEERPKLQPLPIHPYDPGVNHPVRINSQFRFCLETNRYSVPPTYGSSTLMLRRYPDRLLVYHGTQPVAEHLRSYARRQDFGNPAHDQSLRDSRHQRREHRLILDFLKLGHGAEPYLTQLRERRPDWRAHARRILALAQIHGAETLSRVMADAATYGAFSADYLEHLLAARQRLRADPSPLHLTRAQDLLELQLPPADLNPYALPSERTPPCPTPPPPPHHPPTPPPANSNTSPDNLG